MRTLKILIAVVLVAVAGMASAQVAKQDAKTINLTANLNTTISLQLDEEDIVFDFVTLEDYKKGLGRKGGDYSSKGAVSSTTNWALIFRATKDFVHTDGVTKMNLNNLGLTATFEGKNKISNITKYGTISPVKSYYRPLLYYNGRDMNAGDYEDNKFTIYYEMGTKGRLMNKKSIFDQDLKKGSYSTDIEFLAIEIL
ncbi:hypothetical protein EYV94_17735 [Puteibacter caeruleilacunae]|nr:hypothetical protein EYV94_17735 [Puteibacter caeruleilacunae]